jgi:polyhydroxyalkanoate synthesis regulator phasin
MSPMTRRRKLTFSAGAAAIAVLVVGLGAAGAVAASRMLSPSDASKAVIDDAASQLGVKPEALSAALKQALKNRVDEAVKAGRLSEAQAKELKARIDSEELPFLFGPGGRGPGHGLGHFRPFGHVGHFEVLGSAASYLGMTEAELRDALHDKTLAEIAKEKGKSVSGLVAALVAAQEKRIAAAVADGRLTQEQASQLKANLEDRTKDLVNGELRDFRDGRHSEFWPGSGAPRAPPAFGGPPA